MFDMIRTLFLHSKKKIWQNVRIFLVSSFHRRIIIFTSKRQNSFEVITRRKGEEMKKLLSVFISACHGLFHWWHAAAATTAAMRKVKYTM